MFTREGEGGEVEVTDKLGNDRALGDVVNGNFVIGLVVAAQVPTHIRNKPLAIWLCLENKKNFYHI